MNTLKEINEHHKDIQKLNAKCYQQLTNLRDQRKELISINKRICKDCDFWVIDKQNYNNQITGYCHKNPPGSKIRWPKTESSDFCRAFESRYLVFDWLAESRRLFKHE